MPQKALSVLLETPPSVLEGSVMIARVRVTAGEAAIHGGEVTLTRTIAVRYRQLDPDGATHLATARSTEAVVRQPLPARPADASDPYDVEVLLSIPAEGPGSADTELVAVDYAVRARLDLGAHGVAQAVRKVAVLSRAVGLAAVASQPPRTDDHGNAVVAIDRLSSRRIAPGQRLTGDVVVAPVHAGQIRSVRLELVLLEHVPGGPGTIPGGSKDVATVVATLRLASAIDVDDPHAVLRLPFVLEVPSQLRAPSMATADFEIGWMLRAVVSRPLHRDAYAELGLQATTVPW